MGGFTFLIFGGIIVVMLGKFVVKHRGLILALAVVLLIPALIEFFATRVNYDMLNYLPSNTDTVIGQNELLESFGKGAFSMIITEDLPFTEQAKIEEKIRTVEHVDTVLGLGGLAEAGIPPEMLPDELYGKVVKGNESIIAVFFDTGSSADETVEAVEKIRGLMDSHIYVSGMSAFITDLRGLSENEEVFYIIIAVCLAIIVMLALLDNWLAPVLFLVSIGVMVLINMGTNFMFGEISYITKSLSAILQLAVTMDYSIFLWHSYREFLKRGKDPEAAMTKAIKATLSSVVGSAATTVAGFIALCFMSFTLGVDLGIVMAKGVVLGVIGAVTVLPALILVFDKIVRKCDHKSILPDFSWLANKIVRFFPALLIIFVAMIPLFFYGYQKTNENVYYTLDSSLPADMDFAVANEKLSEDFGLANVQMILTPADLSQAEMVDMTTKLSEVEGVKAVLNTESLLGNDVPMEALPESIAEMLKSDKWEMTLIVSEYKTATDEMSAQIGRINEIIKGTNGASLLVGEAALTEDMIEITSEDFARVNTVSIVAIFVIILLVTRSFSLPVILIAVIESAIFINLGLSYFTGDSLSFIAPICISTIQLGATVDYAILMTTRYKFERLDGHDSKEAAKIAIKTAVPSIIVSGTVLFAATIGVAAYSRADMISSLTMLIARGAVISIVAVPAFLPPLLILADPLIIRTTMGMKKLTKGAKK